MTKTLNIAIIGGQFMGRAHSNAWSDVARFYDLPFAPVLHTACDIDPTAGQSFARRLGWQHFETSWEKVIQNTDIDVVDICTPNQWHAPVAIAAARAGKHVICEKPLAMSAAEAKAMCDAAKASNVVHMSAFNYRRVPAIALAHNMIAEGKLGRIHHFNAVYYQDWLVDPSFPYVWRHDKAAAGSGAHGDMNAHTVDLARFLVGDITQVCGHDKIFIEKRKKADGSAGTVTADDSMNFLAEFENGALGNFLATRFATGRKNFLRLEIFGSEGSLTFNLERLNELQYYSRHDDDHLQGFRTIMVTEASHPFIDRWWPPGHIIGWEHTFIHQIGDFLQAVASGQQVSANFYDGHRCQQVLDAVAESADHLKWVQVPVD